MTTTSGAAPRAAGLGLVPALLSFVRFSHTIFALPFALAAACLAQMEIPPAATLGWILLAMGAAGGALAMGSLLSRRDRAATTRVGLGVFAAALAVFGTTHHVPTAFVAAFLCGASYFIVVTALATTLQMRVADEVRGRVMGLWMMAWAGLVPLGGLIAGPIIDLTSISAVLVFGGT